MPIVLIQQHIVTNTPRSADEIRPICFSPFFSRILLGLTTVDISVSSKFQIFWGGIISYLRRASFNLQKKLSTAGRLNPIDRAKLVDSGLRSDYFPDLLQNPRSQSSPAASFSVQLLNIGIFFALANLYASCRT